MRRVLSSRPRANGGSGLLIVMVVVIIAIFAILTFGQSFFTSSITVEADVLVKGDVAQVLADSAIQEAMAQMRHQANTPSTQIFNCLRQLVYAPDLGKLDLSDHIKIPETEALLFSEGYAGYHVANPKVEVVLQKHIDKTEYERIGIIKYTAEVTAPGGITRKAFRRVEVTQPFKTCLVNSPRPFCLGGVFVAKADELTDMESLKSLRSRFISANSDLWRKVNDCKAMAPPSLSEHYKDLERRMIPQQTAVDRTPPVTGEGEAMLIGCFHGGADFYLQSLDLASYLKVYDEKLRSIEGKYNSAAQRASSSLAATGAHDDFIKNANEAVKTIEDALFRIWAQRNSFRYVTREDPFFAKLSEHLYKFDYSYWTRRCQYKVRKGVGEADCNAAWQRYLRDHPSPKGIIRIENDGEPLRLSGLVKGKYVLVLGSGGAIIENFNTNDGPSDVATIVACTGPLKIKGEVHCSLFLAKHEQAPPPDLFIDSQARIVGNLHMWQPPLQPLVGTLFRLEKYSSGITLDGGRVIIVQTYLHVAIAPQTIYRRVSRH